MRIPPGLYVQVNKMLRKLDPNSSYMSSRLETHLKRPTKMKVCSFAAVVFISALSIGTANAGFETDIVLKVSSEYSIYKKSIQLEDANANGTVLGKFGNQQSRLMHNTTRFLPLVCSVYFVLGPSGRWRRQICVRRGSPHLHS
jgi:hypothetical protein